MKGNQYGRQEEVYRCEDCSGCPYAERCKKTEKDRTVRINQELTAMHKEVLENLESIQGALLRMNRSIQAEGTFGIMKNFNDCSMISNADYAKWAHARSGCAELRPRCDEYPE